MSDGLRLLISSTPLWQQPNPTYALPVHVQVVYSVLGRINMRWQTILSSTKDLDAARDAMHAANQSHLFDRLVITEGQSVNRAPAVGWNTIECAFIPPRASFAELMHDMKEKAANSNPPELPKHAFLVGHKQSQNFLLGFACMLALILQSSFALGVVGTLAIIDAVFLMNNTPLSTAQTDKLNNLRNWGYATLNGILLLVILLF